MSYEDIAKQLHFTQRQIQIACATRDPPTKRSGRPFTFSPLQIDQLIDFISLSRPNHCMNYLKLAMGAFARLRVSEFIIGHALDTTGYGRQIALGKQCLKHSMNGINLLWIT